MTINPSITIMTNFSDSLACLTYATTTKEQHNFMQNYLLNESFLMPPAAL